MPGYSNLTVAGTSQSVTGLTTGATYYFRARAANGSGIGANSSVASVTTAAGGGATNAFQEWVAGEGQNPGSSNFVENADYDGDGMTTWQEYVADTDPGNSNVAFEVVGSYANGTLNMGYPASTGRYYQLEYSTNLVSGGTIVSNLGWGGAGTFATNIPGEWYGTIRVRLTAP